LSNLSYVNKISAPDWLDREKTFRMLGRRGRYVAYRAFVLEGNDAETEEFYSKGNLGSIFGDKSFKKTKRTQALSVRPEISTIVEALSTVLKNRSGKDGDKTKRSSAIASGPPDGDVL